MFFFFLMFCWKRGIEGKVHWLLAAGGQNRPVQTRNYSISLHRRHNIHIQQLSNSKGWWKKCFWMYQLTNIFMMRESSELKTCLQITTYLRNNIPNKQHFEQTTIPRKKISKKEQFQENIFKKKHFQWKEISKPQHFQRKKISKESRFPRNKIFKK